MHDPVASLDGRQTVQTDQYRREHVAYEWANKTQDIQKTETASELHHEKEKYHRWKLGLLSHLERESAHQESLHAKKKVEKELSNKAKEAEDKKEKAKKVVEKAKKKKEKDHKKEKSAKAKKEIAKKAMKQEKPDEQIYLPPENLTLNNTQLNNSGRPRGQDCAC